MHVDYKTKGVCSSWIHFDLDEQQCIHNVHFDGGCDGNLKAVSKLVDGQNASHIAAILEGNTCGPRRTSCADQFSKALTEALESVHTEMNSPVHSLQEVDYYGTDITITVY